MVGRVDHRVGAEDRPVADRQPAEAVDVAAVVEADAIAHLDAVGVQPDDQVEVEAALADALRVAGTERDDALAALGDHHRATSGFGPAGTLPWGPVHLASRPVEQIDTRPAAAAAALPTGLVRPALAGVDAYEPGRPLDEVRRELGIESVIKLASNEGPFPPMPGAMAAIAAAAADVRGYPDPGAWALRDALAAPPRARAGAGAARRRRRRPHQAHVASRCSTRATRSRWRGRRSCRGGSARRSRAPRWPRRRCGGRRVRPAGARRARRARARRSWWS